MSKILQNRNFQRTLRRKRVSSVIQGTASRPRLSVFRSNKNMELQLIDDTKGNTLARVSTKDIQQKGNKTELAAAAGKLIAQKALEANIKEVLLDRRHYRYHGRIKAVAEAAREAGLKI